MYLNTDTMKDPRINVLSQEQFQKRVSDVFAELGDILGRSFGPYGAPTIISNYPYVHVTKDGYTIAKSLMYAQDETSMDNAILRLAMDICGRLNNSVGDGTTTAIIATNAIYDAYQRIKDQYDTYFLPRNIIRAFEEIKNDVVKKLYESATSIQSDDPKVMAENIRKVVYISSNGDQSYTDMIGNLYEELHIPAITVERSPDGETRTEVTHGYQADVVLNDKLYINSDNNTMVENNMDVLVFSTTITEEIYIKIIRPLWERVKFLGRKLMIISNQYDTVALDKIIARDINNEWMKTHNSTLILTTVGMTSPLLRKKLGDLAMLLNTVVIDRTHANILCEALSTNDDVLKYINIDARDIPDIYCNVKEPRLKALYAPGNVPLIEPCDEAIRCGFVKHVEAGLKRSVFQGFYCDEVKLNIHRQEAKEELEEAVNKYSKLGTFNLDIMHAENRYYALMLKMGSIHVGADTEMSQEMLKDAVDDAVKAAASAYNNGIILGCNTTLIRILYSIFKESLRSDTISPEYKFAAKVMLCGFTLVQKKVLQNAFPIPSDINPMIPENYDLTAFSKIFRVNFTDITNGPGHASNIKKLMQEISDEVAMPMDYYDLIICGAIYFNKVFDVTTMKYSSDVINSAETDIEVMKATSDLISMLISGNQMVIGRYGGQ